MLLHLKMSEPPIYHYRSKNNIQFSTFKGKIKNFTLIKGHYTVNFNKDNCFTMVVLENNILIFK